MEIKDIKKVENELKAEIDEMGASPDRDARAAERCVPIIKQEIELVMLKSVQNLYYIIKEYVSSNKSFLLKQSALRELKTIEDYRFNLAVIKKYANELSKEVDSLFGTKKDNSSAVMRYAGAKKDFAMFLQEVLAFVDSAAADTGGAAAESAAGVPEKRQKNHAVQYAQRCVSGGTFCFMV